MPNTPSRPSDRRVQTACLLILTLIATGIALALLQQVLVPFVLAVLFAQSLTPMVDFLMRRFRLPQMVAVTLAAGFAAAMVVAVGFLLVTSLSVSESQKAVYTERFEVLKEQVVNSPTAQRWLNIRPGGSTASALDFIKSSGSDLYWSVAAPIAAQAAMVLTNTAVVLILMAFLLYGRAKARRGRFSILNEIEVRVQRYISLTVFISILTGVFVGSTLSILHVQFAAGFGFLAFLLNFIPNLGAVIATLLPLPFIFLDPHLTITQQLLALIIPAGIQVTIGSFVQPRMMGHSMELHPVVLVLSLLFFTMIWHLGGAFLATPVTAVIKIVFEKIPATRPLAAALAGNLEPLAETIESPTKEEKKGVESWESEKVMSGGDEFH